MAINLNECDQACFGCIKKYKKKHNLKSGESFTIECKGIPAEYVPSEILSTFPEQDRESAKALFDPVIWAAKTLDWHCLDPDGEIWKRKNPEEYFAWVEKHPGESLFEKSRYHRPYQAEILRCSSQQIVSRIGRQCIQKDQYVYTPFGPIQAKNLTESQLTVNGRVHFLDNFEDQIYKISFANGTSLKVNKEHPFFDIKTGWTSAEHLSVGDKIEFTPSTQFAFIDNKIIVEKLESLAIRPGFTLKKYKKTSALRFIRNNEEEAITLQYWLWRAGIQSKIIKQTEVIIEKQYDKHLFVTLCKIQHIVFYPSTRAVRQNYSKIKKIELLAKDTVVSFETDSSEITSVCGMRTHNCGKTEALIIKILYSIFTKPGRGEGEGFKVILITPFQAQIDLIFERLNTLIKASSLTQNSIRRSVKAPVYTLELHNGSLVRGFTAGTKSGGNADSVRGQTGHMLLFDEADYLASGDIDSALAIITNNPGATVWMSSTPTGRRERFYQTCLSKQWKEFHYPSHVNPMFSEQLDRIFKEQLTAIGYRHEILAEFGEQEEGVFQNSYVQAARASYKYGQYKYHQSWLYTVGVDWNDTKNGTTIAVLGLDPSRNKFVLVDKYIVSREGWTQLAACQKIAEVNRLWRPMSIYVDAGYGSTQYEVLRKFGFDSLADPTKGPTHPDAKIPHILKQYDFGSRIDTRDIFTGMPLKKDAKPFLVESAMRRFETQDIEIPEYDEDLEKQLLSYVIDRITPTGRPVYKASDESIGDHFLDAVMLSIVAFVLESTPIGKPRIDSSIVFTGYFGEGKDSLVEGNSFVIKPDTKEKMAEEKEKHRPSRRSLDQEQQSLFKSQKDLPANHTHRDTKPGIWKWDGFFRDEPKPQTRTLSQAEGDARKKQGFAPYRGSKPRRKNI